MLARDTKFPRWRSNGSYRAIPSTWHFSITRCPNGRDRAGPRNSRRAGRTRAGAHSSVVHWTVAGVCPRRRRLYRGTLEALAALASARSVLETIGDHRDTLAGGVPPVARDVGSPVPLRILLAEDNAITKQSRFACSKGSDTGPTLLAMDARRSSGSTTPLTTSYSWMSRCRRWMASRQAAPSARAGLQASARASSR